ncbi:PAS domain S-box protein [Variovorax sp. M-6]|uniref:CHASE domain-containing hybrid sensor histidine kinase/response regulator n=1 Tax=Variovorax sp. M-6 TaxID=3233041 RepID=UPI003F969FC5
MSISTSLRASARSLVWLALGLGAAAGAAFLQVGYNESLARTRFEALSRRAVDQVAARMHAFESGLRGARGAVIAAGGDAGITRLRFAQYSASQDIEREFPGSNGFGFIRRVPVDQEAAFVAAARLDGKPDFRVHQLGPNDGERYVIQYFEPSDSSIPAIGLDMASEPRRRAAAERAMATGEIVMSAPITLLRRGDAPRSVLLLLPVYQVESQLAALKQRHRRSAPTRGTRAETIGWIYTPLVLDEVLKGFDFQDGQFAMALADAGDDGKPDRFFVSPQFPAAGAGGLRNVLPLALYGRSWQVEIVAKPLFLKQLNLRSPWAVFLIGATLATLLALLSFIEQVTQRRKQRESEQRSRLAAIVTSSNDAIIGCGLDGKITEWNDAAAKIFGYSADQALAHPTHALLLPPEYLDEEEALLRHVAEGRAVAALETFRRHRDGSPVAVSVAAAPIRSADGRVVGVAQTVRDITHEKATKARILELNATLEQQVSERTAQLAALSMRERAILADAASAIIATDVDGVVRLFNPAAEALLGYPAAEVVDRAEMIRFHDAAEVHARAEALSAELGRPLEVCEVFARAPGAARGDPREWTYVRKDGSRVAVHLNVSPLRDAANAVIGFIAIGSDLTERKLAEEKLRSNERFMRIVTDNIPGIVAYWTPDMRCTFANSAYRRWRGLAPEQMVGTTQRELLGPEQFRISEPYIRAALAGKDQRVMRTRVLADGSTAHYWLHYIPDRDEQGVVQGYISVAVDVTDMRRAQDQLESLNLALKERSAQAESASRAKSEFLANMSHEIRSPLNAVIGLAYLLRQTSLDETQRDFLQKIDASSNALLGVINDILDISKIEAGEMALDESGFDLRELLDGVMAMASVNALGKGIALRLETGDGLPAQLRGDQTRLRQILVNLMSNAVKFTAEGSVCLSVTAEKRQDRHVQMCFAVLDTGIGIESELLGRVFAPFTQADSSTTRRFGGTGLGLTIVKQLTELMGGELGVASTPGSGSEFWVVLPLEIAADAVAPGAASPDQDLSRIRVLVVDDSPVNLLVCQNILGRAGAEVRLAKDGREAVEMLRAGPGSFDLVLMDVHMPVLDGNEATRRIRGELGLAALPVIALTASALVAERERAFEAGMNDFVSKPFDAEALVRTVRRWVERARGGEAPAAPVKPMAEPRLPADWPVIEGIDAVDSFRRLQGDRGLLASALRRLLAEFADLAQEEGAAACADSVVALAARLHKLQGSARTLGIHAVGRHAAEAEAGLQRGGRQAPQTQAALGALAGALRRLQVAVQPFLEAAAGGTQARGAAPPGPEDLADWIGELRQQSVSAMSRFDELGPSLRTRLGAERFEALERAMQQLRFQRAVEILEEAEAALQPPNL